MIPITSPARLGLRPNKYYFCDIPALLTDEFWYGGDDPVTHLLPQLPLSGLVLRNTAPARLRRRGWRSVLGYVLQLW